MRNPRFFIGLALLVVLLVGTVPATAWPASPTGGTGSPTVDPQILAEMASSPDGTTALFILLRERADLAPAYAMTDWNARGQYVYDTLRATADRSQAHLRSWLDARGITYRSFFSDNSLLITADSAVLNELVAFPEVAALRANRAFPQDPLAPSPTAAPTGIVWNINQVGAPIVWANFTRGEGIVVANIDTGVDWTHGALTGQYRCPAMPYDPSCWYDPTDYCVSGMPCDETGHGTHVMGTMVASDSPAFTYTVGMAPGAQWIACKACTAALGCTTANLIACADWTLAPGGNPANRPHVVNNSWSGPGCDPWFQPQVQAWQAAGIFNTFAVGNNGPACASSRSPADYPESFAVGGTDQTDTVASWSSRGPACATFGSIMKPDVTAPGMAVISTAPGDVWATYTGTSMASPHVAGLVALLWSARPDLIGDLMTTEYFIESAALCRDGAACGGVTCPNPNNDYGWGRINAFETVRRALLPTASFEANPYMGCPPLAVQFTDFSYGPRPILSWSWSFGDGATSTLQNPTHTYEAGGDYTAVLTVTNIAGSSSASWVISPFYPAQASFDYAPQSGPPPLAVYFTNTSSYAYMPTWDFGDGGTGSGDFVNHTYAANGSYTVVLTVDNPNGCGTSTISHVVTVQQQEDPITGLTAENSSPTFLGNLTWMTATVTGGTNIGYTWYFGDGDTASGPLTQHLYRDPGLYTAVVEARNAVSLVTASTAVTVSARMPIDPLTGGTLSYSDSHGLPTIFYAPPGAVPDSAILSLTPRRLLRHLPPAGWRSAEHTFDLDCYSCPEVMYTVYLPIVVVNQSGALAQAVITGGPAPAAAVQSFHFLHPLQVTINYSDLDVIGLDENTLTLFYWDGAQWADAACTPYNRNPEGNVVEVGICHLSQFGLIGR